MTGPFVEPVDPSADHPGQVGQSDELVCSNCRETVRYWVKDGRVKCPNCALYEDARGFAIPVHWFDE